MRILIRFFLVAIALVAVSTVAHGQSSTGALTISFTVEPSSTILVLPDGKVQVYVANPPSASDTRPIYFPPASSDKQGGDSDAKSAATKSRRCSEKKS